MGPMTTDSAPARPYSVFIHVPVIFSGLLTIGVEETFVDRALKPGQVDSYGLFRGRIKTIAACFFDSKLIWMFPAFLAVVETLKVLSHHSDAGLPWTAGIILGLAVAFIVSDRFVRRQKEAVDAAIADMEGLIASIPKDDRKRDLLRIQQALNVLQREHGTAFDGRAREAVAAVLDQNLRRPSDKHLIIADSTAVDADSASIRVRTLEEKAAWSRDVAWAEHLVLDLEDAAAGAKV